MIPERTERAKVANVYYYDGIIDNLAECYARCCFEIDKLDEGINFFMKYYNQKYEDDRVYDLLKILLEYNYFEKWMEIYEKYEKDIKNMRIGEDYEYVKKHLKK